MKKHIIFIFLMLIVTATINSQNFDEKLQRLAKEVTLKLSSKKVGTIAVYPFFNIKKSKPI